MDKMQLRQEEQPFKMERRLLMIAILCKLTSIKEDLNNFAQFSCNHLFGMGF